MNTEVAQAQKAAKAIFNWISLTSPEDFKKDGEKFIFKRLLTMIVDLDFTTKGDFAEYLHSVNNFERVSKKLEEQFTQLEQKIK